MDVDQYAPSPGAALRAAAAGVAVLAAEVAALLLLAHLGSQPWARIGWHEPAGWLAATPAADAVAALLHRAASLAAGWLLLATLAHAVATAVRTTRLRRHSRGSSGTAAGAARGGTPSGVVAGPREGATAPAPRRAVPGAARHGPVTAGLLPRALRGMVERAVAAALLGAVSAGPVVPAVAAASRSAPAAPATPTAAPAGAQAADSASRSGESGPPVPPRPGRSHPRATPAGPGVTVNPGGQPGPGTAGSAGRSPRGEVAGARGSATHRVVRGDHLWGIAAARLAGRNGGDRRCLTARAVAPYWRRVVAANRHRLRSGDPDLIFPGERVVLPPLDRS